MRSISFVTLLVLGVPAAEGARVDAIQAPVAPSRTPTVIVDTDAGRDDLMALAFLLASPKVRLEAVCVGTGLAHVAAGAGNILNLLELANRRDVPVYMGRTTPLSGDRQFPPEWRRRSDELTGVTMPRAERRPEARRAADYLAARLSDRRQPVQVLALGGLTNIAEAFDVNPAAARTIQRLVIMGGALRVPGNLAEGGVATNTTAEWNFYVDSEAAQRVFASGAPIRLVPLDATERVPIDVRLERAVQNVARAPLAGVVAQIIASVHDSVERGTYFAWDPLAAAALVDPSVVRFKPAAVRIRQDPPEEGRTVIVPNAKPTAEVAFDTDARKFRELFVQTLAGSSQMKRVRLGSRLQPR